MVAVAEKGEEKQRLLEIISTEEFGTAAISLPYSH